MLNTVSKSVITSSTRVGSAPLAAAATRFFSSSPQYDVAVIGGGPGGYVAAIKAAQLGLKTVCVEKRGTLGGTCLNVGCIPSKSLLHITHKYHEATHDFGKMGIKMDNVTMDMDIMHSQKAKAVKGLTGGIEGLFKANKVDYKKGSATFKDKSTLTVNGLDGTVTEISAKNFIVATGSVPSPMPGGGVVADEKVILTSTGALDLKTAPKTMVIIGGGVIGLELGSVYRRLGSDIIVVEFLDMITPGIDSEMAKTFHKILVKQGFNFHLSTKVTGVTVQGDSAIVHVEDTKTGVKKDIACDKVLLSVGRKPYTDGLGLEQIGVEKDKMGCVVVNEEFRVPSNPHIMAIGDVIKGPMLAHKAEDEGVAAAEILAGLGGHVNYDAIPSVVYTHPEVAGVGKSEDDLKKAGVEYVKGSFPFAANSRARAVDDSEGSVKILTDKKTDKILGAWIIGPSAGEMIHELVVGMEYGASSEDIGRTCHAHPTLSEAVKEACMACFSKPIHNVGK